MKHRKGDQATQSANAAVSTVAGKRGIAIDAFASALFWGFVAVMFGSSEIQAERSIGFGPESIALLCGNIFALIAVGLLGPRANNRHLFLLGFGGATIAGLLLLLISINPALFPLAWSRLFACGSSAILVLAWCEHISSKPPQERPLFLALSSLLTIAVILVFMQLDARSTVLLGGILPIASAALGATRARTRPTASAAEAKEAPLPAYLSLIFFAFGFMISFLSLLNRHATGKESQAFHLGADPFAVGWIALVLVVAGIVWVVLPKRPPSLFTTVLIPLVSLGLILPPYLRYGLQETLPAIVAFTVLCEAIICSVGPSNAKKVMRSGPFAFVFWSRSYGLIGLVVGYAATIFLFDRIGLSIDFHVLVPLFVAYAVLCITVATILGRIGLIAPTSPARESSPVAAAHALAAKYGLTARETQVLELVAQGRNMTYVQKALHISPGTSSTHINHIHQKLGVHSREELLDLVQEELAHEKDPNESGS